MARFPHREAFFGDLHVHTSWSTDAFFYGNRVGPRDAWRFAQGEAVRLPTGIVAQLAVPLDFAAITDHAEGFDRIGMCTDPDHPKYGSRTCEDMRNPQVDIDEFFARALTRFVQWPRPRSAELCADLDACVAAARPTWRRTQAAADEFDRPGRFTALIGYEFTGLLPGGGMLHRNVLFRGAHVTQDAISANDVVNQADFFRQLDAACRPPCEVLTIPHNTNFSWGLMFADTDRDGSEYTEADLERRLRLDRLVEVTQRKGSSECQLGVGAADEDCNLGILFPPCAAEGQTGCAHETSFVRDALLDGIDRKSRGRINPFKLGMIGSTDTHQSDPGNTDARRHSRFAHAMETPESARELLAGAHPLAGPWRRFSEGGLAGVWAEANTRTDIFDALRRREAFATSGSRLRIRFFGGDLPADMGAREDALEIAYARGVAMGGDLEGGDPPTFWVRASQDPDAATLDRIQAVKGWVEAGEHRHRVWDVACAGGREPGEDGRCAPTPASVDTATCERRDDAGAAELDATFTDPAFQPDQHAFYYVRVMENPSCRWTTWFANGAGVPPPDDVPLTVRNRGWSSAIWREP
ncbi:MAG: DUF3604 domain-containing protein [Gammaproteobacteria bacterium]|nr:DUF3604 domain-containing protein [Gammaproteobacteria bacterium]